MARSNFPVYFSMRRMLTPLRDDQLGRVFRAAMDYGELGLDPEHLDQAEQIAYEAMRDAIRRDGEKYDAKCRRMQENAAKGKTKSASKISQSCATATATATATSTTTSTAAATVSHPAERPASSGSLPLPPDTPEGFFSENFTQMTPHYKREMNAFRKLGCTDELLRCAMQDALDHDVRKWCYVRQILERCAAQDIFTAEAYRSSRSAMGGGHNVRVDRAQPSGNDFLRSAVERPRRLKREPSPVPGGGSSLQNPSKCVSFES